MGRSSAMFMALKSLQQDGSQDLATTFEDSVLSDVESPLYLMEHCVPSNTITPLAESSLVNSSGSRVSFIYFYSPFYLFTSFTDFMSTLLEDVVYPTLTAVKGALLS